MSKTFDLPERSDQRDMKNAILVIIDTAHWMWNVSISDRRSERRKEIRNVLDLTRFGKDNVH
jgi:hypothetical protein